MADDIKVGNYTKAGFWELAYKIRYTGFCYDTQIINEKVIDRENMNLAWASAITSLHKIWVRRGGAKLSRSDQEEKLKNALVQVCYLQELFVRFPAWFRANSGLVG